MNFSIRAINFPVGSASWFMDWIVGTIRATSGTLALGATFTFTNVLSGPGTLALHALDAAGGFITITTVALNPTEGSTWEYDWATGLIYEVAPPPPVTFTVTISVLGMGTTDPVAGAYAVAEGTILTITALPASGWQFDSWSGDIISTANPLVVTVASNLNLVANFSQIPPPPPGNFTVNISVQGSGTTNPVPGAYTITDGTLLTVEAIPASGWQFERWDGSLPSTANPLTVTVTGDLDLIAVFSQLPPPPPVGMTLVADITTEETAVGLVEYLGDLYLAAHTNPKNGLPGTVVRYNDLTGAFGVAFSLPVGQGIGDIRVLGDRLYITSIDSGGVYGEIYVYDGLTWQQVTTSPQAASGLFDIEFYNNRFYAAGYDGGTPKLYSSPDGVTNWILDYSYPGVVNRFVKMAVFGGKLFFAPQSSNEPGPMDFPYDIFSYDGVIFNPIKFTTLPLEITDMAVFNNALYLSVWSFSADVPAMYRTLDGVNYEVVPFFGPSPTKAPSLLDLQVYGTRLYAAEYVPGWVLIYESTDGVSWAQTISVPATASAFGTYWWYIHPALGVYADRLFAVPPAEGKLYVSEALPPPPLTRLVTIQATVGGTTSPLSGTYTVDDGSTLIVAATPDAGYTFTGWQDELGAIFSVDNPLALLVNRDRTITAVFSALPPPPVQYTVTVSLVGQGTTSPPPGAYSVTAGDPFSVAALPAQGWLFTGWTGSLSSPDNPLTVIPTADLALVANFAQITFTLAIQVSTGGTTLPAPGSYTYPQGAVVSVSALPEAGYSFVEWQEGGASLSIVNPISVTVTRDQAITAVFQQVVPPPGERVITISVVANGETQPPSGAYTVAEGTEVSVLAVPATGWEFAYWQYDGQTSTTNPLILVATQDYTVTAFFSPAAAPRAQVPVVAIAVGVGLVLLTFLRRQR